MDPYLEDPPTWGNFHLNIIAEIQAVLNRQLRPKYYARAEERVYISDQDDPGRRVIVPDIRVLTREDRHEGTWQPPFDNAALAVAEPIVATTLIEDDIHEFRVEVIDTALRKVVTVIEVLSPTNKVPGARGQDSYRRKRTEVMCSPSHWVEIDLLRDGETLVAGEVLPKGDYFVHVSRVETRPSGMIWPILLPQRLPVIPIPLRAPDPDAKLDLQAILNTIYDQSAYDLDLDYRKEPVPPLPPEYATWATKLLKEKGLR
jgi:hypothetical protein